MATRRVVRSSIDDITGLRAARWIRESTSEQFDRFGPDAQVEQQDRAIERYGLIDTGRRWAVAGSGRTAWQGTEFAEMLAGAGVDWDVLVVGYVSRFLRNLKQALIARDDLHERGAVLLFADERLLSSDEDRWDEFVREAHEAEAYSRRLGRRIREGYEAKFRRHSDQAGSAPLGFRREPPAFTLSIDPATIGRAVAAYERYATDTVSLSALSEETGIDEAALRSMLSNPIYNGWMRRHRRRHDEQRRPAPWRDCPPVSDELWARVQEVRDHRYHGGGHPTPVHVHLLSGRVFCAGCAARIRAEPRRYRHFDACEAWSTSTRTSRVFEEPIANQIQQVRHDAAMLTSLRRLAQAPAPDSTALRRRQLERELAGLASRHARRALSTEAYLAEHSRISGLIDVLSTSTESASIDPDEAIAYLRDIPRMWRDMDDQGRRELALSIYERVETTSDGIAGVKLTPEAIAHGMQLALPEKVLLARPAGARRALNTIVVPIIGRSEARAWVRRIA